MTAWVQTWFPWWVVKYDDEEDEDYWEEDTSLTADKKALAQNRAYAKYLQRLRGYCLSGPREVAAEKSRVIYICPDNEIVSVLK